jgi:hypothetical protein
VRGNTAWGTSGCGRRIQEAAALVDVILFVARGVVVAQHRVYAFYMYLHSRLTIISIVNCLQFWCPAAAFSISLPDKAL